MNPNNEMSRFLFDPDIEPKYEAIDINIEVVTQAKTFSRSDKVDRRHDRDAFAGGQAGSGRSYLCQ